MSQGYWSAVPPTPPARRRAEAEAIYQLLRVLSEDLKQEQETFHGQVVEGAWLEEAVPDGAWHPVTKVAEGTDG